MKKYNFKKLIEKSNSDFLKTIQPEKLTDEIRRLNFKSNTLGINLMNNNDNNIDVEIPIYFQKNSIFETKIILDLIKNNKYYFSVDYEKKYEHPLDEKNDIINSFIKVTEEYNNFNSNFGKSTNKLIFIISSKTKGHFKIIDIFNEKDDTIFGWETYTVRRYDTISENNIYLVNLSNILIYGNISIIKNVLNIEYQLLDLKNLIGNVKAEFIN